jgi:hypothetical protein
MKNFISLGISGIGLALILSGAQAMANEGSVSIVSKTHTAAFHTLSKMPTGEHAAPISMTDEQLNAVEGKLNLSIENLRQEILASIQALVNQQLGQPIPKAESLHQEILDSKQALVKQLLPQHNPKGESLRQEILTSKQALVNQRLSQLKNLPQVGGLR